MQDLQLQRTGQPAPQSEEEKKHLGSGKALVLTQPGGDNRLHIYMMRAVDPQDPTQGILCGEINSMYLWGLSEYDTLPSMTELCVLDKSNNVIYSTIPLTASFHEKSFERGKGILYIIHYENREGQEYRFPFYYERGGAIRFKSQEQIEWRKADVPSNENSS
jgi:hypothetical protein